jgi:lipopolysaccharide transport system permease protein
MESSNDFADKPPLEERVYSAKNSGSGIIQTIRILLKEFPGAHSLGFRFAERNIKTRYRQSILGVVWAFLPPLVTAIIWVILNKYNVIRVGDVGAPYPVFVITGMMLWSLFSNALLMPLQTVQANRSILVKINFPRESLIVTSFYEILFNAFVSLIIIATCLFIFEVHLTVTCLLFIPAMFILIILGLALGLLLLPVSLLFKDVQFVLPSILQFAMYLTPVVYAQPIYKGAAKLLALNPVSPVLTSARAWLLGINISFPLYHLAVVVVVALALFIVGVFLQRKTMQVLIERMGS